ncbi:MAG: winged helix DNA-binding domain-containing protein, partial [Acidimicrobiia bacterium]|nr:winged helix DNA-binding domain-containing protein [Acidimicrobiia bacterium]
MTGARPFVSSERRRLLVMSRHRFGDDQPGVGDGRSGRSGDLDGRLTAVADSLVALHSSDPATVYLSLLARVAAATIDSIGHSLYRRRSLIRVHGMRRTLWVGTPVVAAEIVTASAGRHLAADRRRLIGFLEKAGVVEDGEQFVDAAAEELQAYIERHGPCETRAIGEALPHLTV